MTPDEFYDQLAPFYHLIYPDWETSMTQQAAALDSIMQEFWGPETTTILDVACGIGTQALGLAQLGYQVTASDLSYAAVARARREAAARHLELHCFVADMRHMAVHSQQHYDVVLACDNAVPHLLTDEDILTAFRALYTCVRPGGGCLITVRDYDREDRTGIQVKPYGLRIEGSTRYLLFQVWEFCGTLYELTLYCIEDRGGRHGMTHVLRTTYYAIGTETLMALMTQAGFQDVQRLEARFYQPVLIGTKP
jgi:SAM-dependent methyltransferase